MRYVLISNQISVDAVLGFESLNAAKTWAEDRSLADYSVKCIMNPSQVDWM